MRLLIASGNRHKTREIREILGAGFAIEDLGDHPEITPPEETGSTFLENATQKAAGVSRQCDAIVLADDSGIEVDALGGAPGVYSARYDGPGATDESNRHKLLAELERTGARGRARTGRFRCVVVIARDGVVLAHFDGVVEGVIIDREKGVGGFGYDPVFVPGGYSKTFAELPAEEKHSLSHRGKAVAKAAPFLRKVAAAAAPDQWQPGKQME